MLCKKCGRELPYAGGKFCPFCGAPVEQTGVSDETEVFTTLPEELRKDGRTFVIYREHNGVVELLKDLDNDPATVTIESDQFSVFALAYSDGQAGVSSGEAGSSSASGSSGGSSNDKYVPTGDGFPAAVVSAVLLISAALVLVLVKGKRGKASE